MPVEEALLDATASAADETRVIDLVLRVTQQRLTSVARLASALAGRRAHPWRHLLLAMLEEVRYGVTSPLEREYLHRVERAHGLPRGVRNVREADGRYRDVRYPLFGILVELDGREAHPSHEAFRDRARDNAAVISGDATLRYGWRETVGDACGVAAEVAAMLTARGWTGVPASCGAQCGSGRRVLGRGA